MWKDLVAYGRFTIVQFNCPGRGFSIVKRLPDDRGPGIDTLYFGKTR